MISQPIIREYLRLRAKDWPAVDAMRAARVSVQFSELEARGLVKVACEPELEDWSMFEPDFKGLYRGNPKGEKEARKRYAEHMERVGGYFWYACYYRLSNRHEWEEGDSIGAVDGDWKDCGYDTDVKERTIEALDKAYERDAQENYQERATYATA